MERRRFLQLAGLAGLAVVAPLAARKVRADTARYPGPFWIMVNAGGGWDPTMLCDPKGGKSGDKTTVNQTYAPDQIKTIGGIRYAPLSYSVGNIEIYSTDRFFSAHHGRLLVMNGVDTQTNNHDAGSRTVWSGQLGEGYPSFAALAAGVVSETTPLSMAYISNGGYDSTGGLIPLTRVGSVDSIETLAHTNVEDATNPTSGTFHTPATATRIAAAQQARLQAAGAAAALPNLQQAMSSLFLARGSEGGLSALAAELVGKQLVKSADLPDLAAVNDLNQLSDMQYVMQQAQLALYAFKAGVAVSANLSIGGFDTHSDHDARQGKSLVMILRALDYLFRQIDAQGLTNSVYVVVGSDFGRTPYYNANNGKDHWNLTSVLAAGPKISGGRTIGGTAAGFMPETFNATTLAADPGGERIGTNHVHLALRRLANVDQSDLAQRYPLPGDNLPLFG